MIKWIKVLDNAVLSLVIKVIILGLLLWALYEQLIAQNRLSEILIQLKMAVQHGGGFWVLICVLLMFANWGVEALKWKNLMNKLFPIRYIRAFKAVWTGVTLGLFTPNRIGEYGGRLLYVPGKYRWTGIVSSLIGSFAQIVVTFLVGLIMLIIFLYTQVHLQGPILGIFLAIAAMLIIIFLLAYYNMGMLIDLMRNRRVFRKVAPHIQVLSNYALTDFSFILFLSLFRYAIFSAQYLILLWLFGVHIQFGEGCVVIGVIFLAQTVLPSFTVAELLTRGNISLYFLHYYSGNSGAILAASTGLWLLNLIIPAMLGYFFILRKNFFKTKTND
jgi:hypothetical protein